MKKLLRMALVMMMFLGAIPMNVASVRATSDEYTFEEISELIYRGKQGQQGALSIAVLFLQHEVVSGRKADFSLCIVEFVECPAHVLLVRRQGTCRVSFHRSK